MTKTATAFLTVEDVPVGDLHAHPRNPRTITKARLEHLMRTLEAEPEMLRARPIIAKLDGTVVAGNQRLAAAIELGWETIPTVYAHLTAEQETRWMLLDNRPFGEDDEQAVAVLLAELDQASEADLDLTGYTAADTDRLLRSLTVSTKDPDEVPDAPAVPKSVRGQVYELGPHRLMCGDACDRADVEALTGGASMSSMVTDPPYGVGVDHRWREAAGKSRLGTARGAITGDDQADWSVAYALIDAPVAYVWHSALYAGLVQEGLATAGFEVRQQIVWVKDVFAIGRAAYQWKHETCWYAVRKGATAKWSGGRSQTTVWSAPSPIHIMGGGHDDARTPHPTQKPLAIYTPAILNHTERGDVVCDPFAGSGTCLIACEIAERRCFAMEIDTAYCDVIRQRYADYTGQPEYQP